MRINELVVSRTASAAAEVTMSRDEVDDVRGRNSPFVQIMKSKDSGVLSTSSKRQRLLERPEN
jgi:hypothetical protein